MNHNVPSSHAMLRRHQAKPDRRLTSVLGGMALAAALFRLSAMNSHAALETNATVGPPAPMSYRADWRWVKGAVFVPTKYVNEAQQWDEYDPIINDRELHYASVYGINCVRVYLHYYIYLKKKDAMLKDIENFLTLADKYGIKTEFVFFDDCWNQPEPALLSPDYQYPAPIFGVHNSRWLVSPGEDVRKHYDENKLKLKAYVQDIVNAHKADPRITFWETYNEPNHSAATRQLLHDAYEWVHETGTTIPLTATGGSFAGDPYSDFASWHEYGNYNYTGLPDALNTECMNRSGQTVPGIVEHFKGQTGFILWEFGIGRDNCRFTWDENRDHPRKEEAVTPFHGIVYPDGHPWSVADVKALLGAEGFVNAPLFDVEYFKDAQFTAPAKKSVTPMIDFNLGTERGTGSPDAAAGVPSEHFSVRWTGMILPPGKGIYTFYADGDNQVKVFVAGKLLLAKNAPERKEISKKVKLAGDQPVKIKIEYVHAAGDPVLHISWSGPDFDRQILTPIPNAHAP
jgi:hypothetical protein